MIDNIKILITAIASLFWFKGMYRMLDRIVEDTWFYNIIMVLVALFIFYIDDGKFYEIGKTVASQIPQGKRAEYMNNEQ